MKMSNYEKLKASGEVRLEKTETGFALHVKDEPTHSLTAELVAEMIGQCDSAVIQLEMDLIARKARADEEIASMIKAKNAERDGLVKLLEDMA